MPEYILDIQGFRRSSNLLQVKELAIISVGGPNLPTICVFKPPCKFSRLLYQEQRTNAWLERSFHGIPWNSGWISFNNYTKVLRQNLSYNSQVYVKGFEKKVWLEQALPGIFVTDMDELGCPSLKELEKTGKVCHHHPLRQRAVCAVENVYSLETWLLKQREQSREGLDVVDSTQSSRKFQEIS